MDVNAVLAEVNRPLMKKRREVADEVLIYVAKRMATRGYRHTPQSLELVRAYLNQRLNGKGTILKGPVGVGKSFFFQTLGVPALNMQLAQGKEIQEIAYALNSYHDHEILVDDIGAENPGYKSYGSSIGLVDFILENRADSPAATHFTMNLTPQQLLDRYGERTVDRLTGLAEWRELKGESQRRPENRPLSDAWFRNFFRGRLWTSCADNCRFYDRTERRCTRGKTEEPRTSGGTLECPYF